MFIEEGHILKKLPNSANIIKYIDSGKEILVKKKNQKSTQVLYHIFEYIDHGILYNYIDIEKNLKGFGEIIGRIIFKQILNGIEIYHFIMQKCMNLFVHNLLKNYVMQLQKWIFQ